MTNTNLASFILFAVDVSITIFFWLTLYGHLKKKVFALGRWYVHANEPGLYWQVMAGYLMLIILLVYFRFYVFPEKLFPHLAS